MVGDIKLVTVPEMQQIEREADAAGLTYEKMMENAGWNLAQAVARAYGYLENLSAMGLVGSGNNGGDTLVALASLAGQGWKTAAYIVRPRPKDDPLVERVKSAGGEIICVEDDSGYERLSSLLEEYDVMMDGVLGTGARLPLKTEVASMLQAARNSIVAMDAPPFVVAVDCPSGVDCDTGEAAQECIPADLTVTMAAVKRGLLNFPAYNYVGRIEVVGIGLEQAGPIEAYQSVHRWVTDADRVLSILPDRPLDSHKGTFGTALIVAGSVNYTGAVLLSGEAAYRIGAGLVILAIPAPLYPALAGQFTEATWLILPDRTGVIAENADGVIRENLNRATAMLVGPGFGLEDTTRNFIQRLIGGPTSTFKGGIGFVRAPEGGGVSDKTQQLPPMVFDADGLKLLARISEWPRRLPPLTVLTPHPGEMAVLTGLSKDEIQKDRIGTALRFSKEWGHVVVLKGAFTVIASPEGQVEIIPVATPALARAGTGDVLAGLIVGLRAQGVEAFRAAVAGAWLHAHAGLRAAEALGNTASVLAGDVLNSVVDVLSSLQ